MLMHTTLSVCIFRSLLFQLHLEAGLTLLHYFDYKEADKEFEAARKLCGVEFGFTGMMFSAAFLVARFLTNFQG